MPIFIARAYDGAIESIVLAKSQELATVFWQGKGVYPHSIDVRSEKDLDEHITGVLPILTTVEKTVRPYDISTRTGSITLRVIER